MDARGALGRVHPLPGGYRQRRHPTDTTTAIGSERVRNGYTLAAILCRRRDLCNSLDFFQTLKNQNMPNNSVRNLRSKIGCHCWGDQDASIAGLPHAAQVGCRWVRSTRPMQMDCLLTDTPGKYDFGRYERSVDLAVEQGMSVLGILDARWGNETGLNVLGCCSPVWEHLDVWKDFTRQVVGHFKDRVNYWEVINEPPFFWWYPTPPGVRMPSDNPDLRRAPIRHYATLLKASAEAIREADPQAKIVAGAGFADGAFLRRLYEYGCKDAFDIASVHYVPCRHPEDFARQMRILRTIMAECGDVAKPLWDTESGSGGAVIGHAVQTPAEYEAVFNVYRHCFAHEFGLDRYFWFNATSAKPDAAGQLQPEYRAIGTITRLIGDGKLLGAEHLGGEAHLYVFQGVNGPVSVVWSTAPAVANFDAAMKAISHLGEPLTLEPRQQLSGRPLFICEDLRRRVGVSVTGGRETIAKPMKQPAGEPLQVCCPRAQGTMEIDDPAWDRLPWMATRQQIAAPESTSQVSRVSSSVPAELKLAWDEGNLYLRATTFDERLDVDLPTGLVQFSLRDGNPSIAEWGYYTGGWCVLNLFASKVGPRVLSYHHILGDQYPPGLVSDAKLQVKQEGKTLVFCARLPWDRISPVRPGAHEPVLLMFTFNRADAMLDVPAEDEPWEWSHTFVDTFIVKKPALSMWVRFGVTP